MWWFWLLSSGMGTPLRIVVKGMDRDFVRKKKGMGMKILSFVRFYIPLGNCGFKLFIQTPGTNPGRSISIKSFVFSGRDRVFLWLWRNILGFPWVSNSIFHTSSITSPTPKLAAHPLLLTVPSTRIPLKTNCPQKPLQHQDTFTFLASTFSPSFPNKHF